MKTKIFTLWLLVLISIMGFGQSFEGKIIYHNTYKSHDAKISDAQWTNLMGSEQKYYIKNGNYKSILGGTYYHWQMYINKDNKIYNKVSASEAILWNDGSEQEDIIERIELNKNTTEVLGYPCDELILYCKSGVQKYYYNSKFYVDPKLFINHKYGNWYFYLSKAKALPLKSIIDNQFYTIETVATEIIPMEIKDNEFKLPEEAIIEKSPY